MTDLREEIWKLMETTQGAIAAEIRVMLHEPVIPVTNFTPENQRRRIAALQECAASTSDEERHEAWVKRHVDEGWVYGDEFDSAKKTHPNILPWVALPHVIQSKARIFDIIAKAALSLETLLSSGAAAG